MGLVGTTRSRGNDLIDDDRARGSQPFGLRQWLAAVPPAVTSPRSMTPGREILVCVYSFGWGMFVNISHVYIDAQSISHQLSASGLSHSLRILSLISATNEMSRKLSALRTLSASMRP